MQAFFQKSAQVVKDKKEKEENEKQVNIREKVKVGENLNKILTK